MSEAIESPNTLSADIATLLHTEINPNITSLSEEQAAALAPAVLDHLSKTWSTSLEQPDNKALEQTAQLTDTEALVFFTKYATPDILPTIWSRIQTMNPNVQTKALHLISSLASEDSVNNEAMRHELSAHMAQILSNTTDDSLKQEIVNAIFEHPTDYIPLLLKELSLLPLSDNTRHALAQIANGYSYFGTIDLLRDMVVQEKDEEKKKKLEDTLHYLMPNLDKQEFTESLIKLYDNVDFKEFTNYGLTQKEAAFLADYFTKKDANTLDLGCGTGRLLKVMQGQGFQHLFGIDNSPKHAEIVKQELPDIPVAVGDWHKLPYIDKSFENLYCLGRSFLHNITVQDQLNTLHEAWRVLDKDGTMVIDIPDISVGSYAEAVSKFKEETVAKGITHFTEGAIYDSPDGSHFWHRFAPSRSQFELLAKNAGFIVEKVEEVEIPNGHGDKNLYFILKKDESFDPRNSSPDQIYQLFKSFSPLSSTL